jgi:hypothetical protein
MVFPKYPGFPTELGQSTETLRGDLTFFPGLGILGLSQTPVWAGLTWGLGHHEGEFLATG